jgi:hypothetical protein
MNAAIGDLFACFLIAQSGVILGALALQSLDLPLQLDTKFKRTAR